jgi:hypothetical protein
LNSKFSVQQLLQHQQNNTAAAAILGPIPTANANINNPHLTAVALAAAQNHNPMVATSTTLTGWQPPAGTMNGHQTTGPCSTIFIANLGPGIFYWKKIKTKNLQTNYGRRIEEFIWNVSRLFLHSYAHQGLIFF